MKKILSTLKEKLIKTMQAIDRYLDNNPKQQLGLIIAGELLGYLCGVPMPLLTAAPFIFAPTLLQPIINYAYLTIPFGIIAQQVNRDPALYLTGHLFNLAAIGGLFLNKKILFVKIATVQTINQYLDKHPKQQLGLIIVGEVLGYLCGVPLPLLITAPFIFAPTLLQPIINYTYLTIPFSIIAQQINKNPALYLTGHLFNLATIGGLLLGKKIISAKIASSQPITEGKLSTENDHSDNSQKQPALQLNPEPVVESVFFQYAPRDNVPPSRVFDNLSNDDSLENSNDKPPNYKNHS